jgi:anthranilate phosphoribosyltransferase
MTPTAHYTAVIPSAPPVDAGPVPNPLPRLLAGEDLSAEDSQHLFERLVLGRLEPGEIGGMLIALRMKGETPEEMIGAAQALLAAATPRSSGRTGCSQTVAELAAMGPGRSTYRPRRASLRRRAG